VKVQLYKLMLQQYNTAQYRYSYGMVRYGIVMAISETVSSLILFDGSRIAKIKQLMHLGHLMYRSFISYHIISYHIILYTRLHYNSIPTTYIPDMQRMLSIHMQLHLRVIQCMHHTTLRQYEGFFSVQRRSLE